MADEVFTFNSTTFPQMSRSSSIVVNQTYSWINNVGFYAAVNPVYYSYYYNNVRRMSYWLDGFVPTFHKEDNGIFSTRFANSLVNSIGDQIIGRRLLFKNVGLEKDKTGLDNASLKFSEDWAKRAEFQTGVKKAEKYALGLGTSLIKLNVSKGDLWCEPVRLDYFYFEVNGRGELQEVTCLLKGYTDVSRSEKENINYYLVEKRFFKSEKETTFVKDAEGNLQPKESIVKSPCVVYQVHKYVGNILNNQTYDTSMSEDVRWDSLPKKIKDSIKKDYSIIKIGEPQALPFKQHLGAYLITADDGNISLPQVPFGTSILENLVAYLMGYDIAFSYFFRDMYQSKGIVIVPKYMQSQSNVSGNRALNDPFSGLDQSMFTGYQTTSQEKQAIEKVQFELRGLEWAQVRDYLVENIAMQLQLSPRTIASFLASGEAKTATQTNSEDSNSISFIETRRSTLEKPINKMLKDVCDYYHMPDKVEIRFSKEGVINRSQLLADVDAQLRMGVIDLYSALKEIMIDSDESQILERYNKLKEESAEKQANALKNASGFQLM